MEQEPSAGIWKADPHTLAKVAILKSYLYAWFQALGRRRVDQRLLYVDGFAGPGRYTNSSEGSPVAALVAAREVLASAGDAWQAAGIDCAFIESDLRVATQLKNHLQPFEGTDRLNVQVLHSSFEAGIAGLRETQPGPFQGREPLFVFVDPFGPTGAPFATVQNILSSPTSEVLVNLDADGIVRILQAGASANGDALLTSVFGDESWRGPLVPGRSFRDLCLEAVNLYKSRLRSLQNVRYVFSFEMLTSRRSVGSVGYFLVFASQHPLGLEKMKEAMKRMDQTGSYQFSNAMVGRSSLFRFDEPSAFSSLLFERFQGRERVSYSEVADFALNETPFVNPKSMLRRLEEQGLLTVESIDPKRRKGTFNEQKIRHVGFREDRANG